MTTQRKLRYELATFSEKNEERCIEAFHPVGEWSPTDWMTAVAGEVGEAANLIKKARRSNYALLDHVLNNAGGRTQREWIGEELADAVTYIDLLCTSLGIDLSAVLAKKFNEVSEREGSTVHL